MLYLISLGLNDKGISLEGIEALKTCKKVYLENYTVEFPYKTEKLAKITEKTIDKIERADVESDKLVNEAKKQDIALLVYGSPLFATTHLSLLLDCKKAKVKTHIVYSASVFDAVAETGLQLYKFGKVSSISKWGKNFEPDSFLQFVEQNKSIGAHSLILVDIGLEFEKALNELEAAGQKRNFIIDTILICSNMGTDKSKIFYGTPDKLRSKKVAAPFCFIIPGEMHFLEEEAVERFE